MKMKNSEVRVREVKNGFVVTFMDPVTNKKGGGEFVERELVIEGGEGKERREAFSKLINFFMDYYQVTYTKDIKATTAGVELRDDTQKA